MKKWLRRLYRGAVGTMAVLFADVVLHVAHAARRADAAQGNTGADGVHAPPRPRSGRRGQEPRLLAPVGELLTHQPHARARRARHRRRRLLPARRRRPRRDSKRRWRSTGPRASSSAAARRSPSSSPRISTCRRRRNPYRKLTELFVTRRLEVELSKARILELYLNLIEWGDGIWGAEAAARAYFGVPASALSAEQSALLAGAIINPRVYRPSHPNARLRNRQRSSWPGLAT